ncbi:MAG TPA: V-type ATP synthase subunit I [archaeon]|nr:V-type ATP synthase subunit I [archaeon]
MLYPTKMCKVRLIGLKSNLRKTIESLEKFGGAEIKKVDASPLISAKPFEDHEQTVEKLLQIEALLSILPPGAPRQVMSTKEATAFLKSAEFRSEQEQILGIKSELDQLDVLLDSIKDDKNRLRLFSNIDMDFGSLKSPSIQIIAGLVPVAKSLQFNLELSKLQGTTYIERAATKSMNIILIAAQKDSIENIAQDLPRFGFERITIPAIKSTPQKQIEELEKNVQETENKKNALQKKLAAISRINYSKIAAAKEMLDENAKKSSTSSLFATTEHSFVVEAYLPEKNYNSFESHMQKEFPSKIEIRKFTSKELAKMHEEPPTLLEHSKALAPFEFMTKFVSVPKSTEMDPTILFVIFFPLFYAMMVGDFVYGLLSFLLARFLLTKSPVDSILRPVSQIWMWSAIPTIIFGIIFDEFAGMSHTELVEKVFGVHNFVIYHGLERLHETQALLTITILMGIATMALGFLLGFKNALSHSKKHAIAKLAWFCITVFGSALVATGMFAVLPPITLLPLAIIVIAALVALLWAEGPIALIEIPSVVGNILSFARILAVGLVGVIIALILNDLAFPSLDKGILLIVVLPLYIVGHIFNAFLAMFESFVQGARLNYVEFYSKFYEGGGREFVPFKFIRKYIKD